VSPLRHVWQVNNCIESFFFITIIIILPFFRHFQFRTTGTTTGWSGTMQPATGQ
jgi:hypothetical protein